jgi:hypothetical protein
MVLAGACHGTIVVSDRWRRTGYRRGRRAVFALSMKPNRSCRNRAAALMFVIALAACRSTHEDGAAQPSASRGESIAAELLELCERDQAARNAAIEAMGAAEASGASVDFEALWAPVATIDAESTAYLERLIDAHGWPTVSLVGERAAHAAWLLVQHADARPQLQERALELMRPLVAAGEASGVDVAYLEDRVRVARGDAQLYGTQFGADEHGVQRPFAIEDAERVDERRAELGLEPLAQYAEALAQAYGGEAAVEPLPLQARGAP